MGLAAFRMRRRLEEERRRAAEAAGREVPKPLFEPADTEPAAPIAANDDVSRARPAGQRKGKETGESGS